MKLLKRNLLFLIFAAAVFTASGQTITRELNVSPGARIEIINRFGRVEVNTKAVVPEPDAKTEPSAQLTVNSKNTFAESDLNIQNKNNLIRIEPKPKNSRNRIDITLTVPERSRLKIETIDGEVLVSGNLELIEVKTETGTIAVDIPTDDIRYELLWTESRPRFLSDFELEQVKEKSAGKFLIKGRLKPKDGETDEAEPPASAGGETPENSQAKGNGDSANPKSNIQDQ